MMMLSPSPGVRKRLVMSGTDEEAAAGATGPARVDALSGMGGLRRFAVVDDGQHLFAHADEGRLGLDPARIAMREELARERHGVVDVRDAARAGAHDDQPRGQE